MPRSATYRCANANASVRIRRAEESVLNIWAVVAPLLLALPAAGLWLWLVDPDGRTRLGLREASLWAATAWAVFASLVIELVSIGAGNDLAAPAGGNLSRPVLALIWAPLALLGSIVIWRRRAAAGSLAQNQIERARALRGLERYLACFTLGAVALVALVALLSAPTTWDSMTYHLARVAAWIQLGGVSHYATHAEAQLFQPPGSEYLIAQLQVLSGGDRWAAFVQTIAYVLAIGGASLIAKRLGGSARAQLLAAFFVATAPMAIMQGSSTQNDLLVGLWLLIAGSQALALLDDAPLPFAQGVVAAAAVALAVLTKGTAWIYLPPLLLLLLWACLRRLGATKTLALAGIGLTLLLALNAGQWQRNHQTYGTYVFTGSGFYDYSNDSLTPATLFSNLARNSALYLASPSERLNEQPAKAVRSGLSATGIDADDPSTTFPGLTFKLAAAGPSESNGPSPLLFLLGVWALAAVCLVGRLRTKTRLAWAAVITSQVLLFALLIKWQIWHTRLHLPVLLAATPLIALALSELPANVKWRSRVTVLVVAAASLLAPIYLLLNVDRPVIGYAGHSSILTSPRAEQYFANRPELARPYLAAIDYLNARAITRLAFYGGFDDWYYPASALTGDDLRASYVLIGNPSAKYPPQAPGEAQAILCFGCDGERQAVLRGLGFEQPPGLAERAGETNREEPSKAALWVKAPAL